MDRPYMQSHVFKKLLGENGRPAGPEMIKGVRASSMRIESTSSMMQKLKSRSTRPSAVCCVTTVCHTGGAAPKTWMLVNISSGRCCLGMDVLEQGNRKSVYHPQRVATFDSNEALP